MKKISILAVSLAVLGAAAILSSCGKSAEAEKPESKDLSQVISVKTETIEPRKFTEVLRVTGTLAAFDDITVPAEEGGRLLKWEVARGGRVTKGQVLARIDDAMLKAGYDAANAQYQIAEMNASKQAKVYQEQGISEFQIRSFEYQRDAAKAGADLARTRLEKCAIKSPVNGVLDYQFIDAGEMVGPGMPAARVVDVTRLKILAGVPERYAGSFRVGDAVTFTVDAFPGEKFSGKLTYAGAAVSKDNRAIPVEVTVTSGGGKLKPDMIATMLIEFATRADVIAVREDYLQQVEKGRFVLFVENNGVAEERKVEVGGSNGDLVQIKSGLAAGDKLITLGFQNVASGQRVAVKN
jgi:RND family efflux transporter MFP subunit